MRWFRLRSASVVAWSAIAFPTCPDDPIVALPEGEVLLVPAAPVVPDEPMLPDELVPPERELLPMLDDPAVPLLPEDSIVSLPERELPGVLDDPLLPV